MAIRPMMAIRWTRVALVASAAVGFGTAGMYATRLALADYWYRQETVAATEKAIGLTPDQSAYRVRLALLAGDENPALAVASLRRAVELNPADGRAWVELGLRLEETGNSAGAERALLHAADVDRTYLPRWTLANFYFRRHDTDRFWQWAKATVPMIYGDPLPLFHLCGRIREDGELIERLDIHGPQLQAAYLFYLLGVGREDLVGPASLHLLRGQREEDTPLLLTVCDRLIEARRVDDASNIWLGLVCSGRLPFGNGGERPAPITNGDFRASPTSRGFDWRLPAVEGVSAAREEGDGGLRLTFSGAQPEQTEPLVQFVQVKEKTAYDLKFSYRTATIGTASGLAWRVADEAGPVLKQGDDLSSDAQSTGELAFVTPAGCRMVRLSIVCERRAGSARISGLIVLRGVALTPASDTATAQTKGPR